MRFRTPIKAFHSLCVAGLLLCPAAGRCQDADTAGRYREGFMHRLGAGLKSDFTTPVAPKGLKWKAIVVPAALVGYGTISATSGWFNDVNLLGRRWASGNEDPDRKT